MDKDRVKLDPHGRKKSECSAQTGLEPSIAGVGGTADPLRLSLIQLQEAQDITSLSVSSAKQSSMGVQSVYSMSFIMQMQGVSAGKNVPASHSHHRR